MTAASKMHELTSGLPTVSAKIRALDAEGFSRSEIAKFLGKRYQHVRNVLVEHQKAEKPAGGFAESSAEWEPAVPERLDVQLGPGGRVVIPAVFRKAMQVEEGGRLMARVVDGELRLISPKMAVRRAQRLVKEIIPEGVSLVDELIAERRWEAEQEMADG